MQRATRVTVGSLLAHMRRGFVTFLSVPEQGRGAAWHGVAFGALACMVFSTRASAASYRAFTNWMDEQKAYSIQYMMENISPAGTAPGAVVASPSRDNPNYFYHWVRDGSLVTDVVVGLDELATGQDKAFYDRTLDDLIDFSRQLQLTPNLSGGLGEPKFNVDGSAFQGAWGRPQDDGPALRAIALTH